MVNFRDVRGTANADSIAGDAAGNRFLGTAGNDTIDYSGLGGAVTLLAQGVIDKGALGTDSIANMERIVGAAGFLNRIDGTVANPATQTTSFNVNLATQSLTINGIPGLGSVSFTVANFVDVTGTNNADIIAGDLAANTLTGSGGNDSLRGVEGDDILFGGTGNDTLTGLLGADVLTTGKGLDAIAFVNRNEGADLITDFNVADDVFLITSSGFADALPLGQLAPARFAANISGTPTVAVAQFVYDTNDGLLFFDIDGTGGIGPTLLATLVGAPAITAADFVVIV